MGALVSVPQPPFMLSMYQYVTPLVWYCFDTLPYIPVVCSSAEHTLPT